MTGPHLRTPVAEALLSVVAPCYDEEATLAEFTRRVTGACRELGVGYEVVLVNDGSRDRTWERMVGLAQEYPELVCVNLARNHGHQLALTAGLHICRGGRVLIIDADLQDPPELLPEMMKLMDGGADVVYAQRRRRAGETITKRWTAAIFYRLIGLLTDVPIPADTGDFRLMSRRVLDVLLSMPERHRFIRGMVSWVGFTQVPIAYDRDARFAGTTGYSFHKMMRFALDAVTSFSIKPLTWASKLGFMFAVLAGLLIVYSLAGWLSGKAAPGWTSLMAVVSLLGGVQLFFLGMLGEYVGRLYDQSKGRPLFIIERVVTGDRAGTEGMESEPETSGGSIREERPWPVVVMARPGARGQSASRTTGSEGAP